MPRMENLTARRSGIIEEMEGIRTMRKGVLNATYRDVTHKDGEVVTNGPYYKLSRKGENNKTISWSIPASDVAAVQADVDNYKRFRELSDEYVDVCEQIALSADSCEADGAKKN